MRRWILLVLFFLATSASADVQVTLRNAWIHKYAGTATITAQFTFDKAPTKIHPQKDDGEIHLAGRAPQIELPTVAEVTNARSIDGVLPFVQGLARDHKTKQIEGAWRLWCEHAGQDPQVQGEALEPFTTTNPEHLFEVHPLKRVDDQDFTSGFKPIEGYKEKDAAESFEKYENLRSQITIGKDDDGKPTTTIRTGVAGNNFVKFQLRLREAPVDTTNNDGFFVMAKVETLDGELLVHKRRMVFVKDTPPAERVKSLGKDDCLVVLGMPRISLALVSWRISNTKNKKYKDVLNWNLPYEMIIVGTYEDETCADAQEE
jgi:hypothetical protein